MPPPPVEEHVCRVGHNPVHWQLFDFVVVEMVPGLVQWIFAVSFKVNFNHNVKNKFFFVKNK